MKISSLSGGLGIFDIMARHGSALVPNRPRVQRDPKMVKVNTTEAKEKSGTTTDKNPEAAKKVTRTQTTR